MNHHFAFRVPRQWVSRAGAAEHLGVTPEALRKMTGRHGVPCRRVGRRVFYELVALDLWMERQQQRRGKRVA